MSSVSGSSTPNSRFTSQAQSSEELLKEQTLGLVQFSDFRKRKADADEQSSQDGLGAGLDPSIVPSVFKKKKKVPKKSALSFGDQEDEDASHVDMSESTSREASLARTHEDPSVKRKLKPNTSVAFVPKSQSKSALAREAQLKETLKKEYLQMQETVRNTDFMLPFVFFDGKDAVGGKVRMKKGDLIWLFLERARKVGAETATKNNANRKDWARISVDDLMLVRQDLIMPPHFDFHYFIVNSTNGYHGPLFSLSSKSSTATLTHPVDGNSESSVSTTALGSIRSSIPTVPEQELEGFSDDPSLTRVVDRRWYEKNKHIYPATLWEDFDAQRDYSKGGRKDREGNQMFFSR